MNNKMENKKEVLTVKSVLVDFCDHTTVHGLHFLTRIGHRWIQLFWSVVVLSGFIGLGVHLYNIIGAYLEYKTTEYSYERDDGYDFPDITMCNLNGISPTNLRSVASKYEQVQYYLNMSTSGNEENAPLHTDLFWSLGDNSVEVGQTLSDFIIRCKFEDQFCNMSRFIIYTFSSFFNCYTFTMAGTGIQTITQGIAAGLTMTFFLEPLDFSIIKPYDDNAFAGGLYGIRVLLTPPNSLPGAGVMGYDILAGQATNIAFDIIERKRLPEPYSTCRGVDSMALEGHLTYSFTECKNICIHQIIMDECGCFPTKYRVRRNYTAIGMPNCGHDIHKTRNKDMLTCQEYYLKNIETRLNYAVDCNCHPPCEDTKYSITISQSGFPSENSIISFWKRILEDPKKKDLKAYKNYQKLKEVNTSTDDLIKWTHKHFLRLTVYANSKTVTVKEQIPMYTFIDLMSQIGGCLGLWVGISIITIVEFFDLGMNLFQIFCRKAKKIAELDFNSKK